MNLGPCCGVGGSLYNEWVGEWCERCLCRRDCDMQYFNDDSCAKELLQLCDNTNPQQRSIPNEAVPCGHMLTTTLVDFEAI